MKLKGALAMNAPWCQHGRFGAASCRRRAPCSRPPRRETKVVVAAARRQAEAGDGIAGSAVKLKLAGGSARRAGGNSGEPRTACRGQGQDIADKAWGRPPSTPSAALS